MSEYPQLAEQLPNAIDSQTDPAQNGQMPEKLGPVHTHEDRSNRSNRCSINQVYSLSNYGNSYFFLSSQFFNSRISDSPRNESESSSNGPLNKSPIFNTNHVQVNPLASLQLDPVHSEVSSGNFYSALDPHQQANILFKERTQIRKLEQRIVQLVSTIQTLKNRIQTVEQRRQTHPENGQPQTEKMLRHQNVQNKYQTNNNQDSNSDKWQDSQESQSVQEQEFNESEQQQLIKQRKNSQNNFSENLSITLQELVIKIDKKNNWLNNITQIFPCQKAQQINSKSVQIISIDPDLKQSLKETRDFLKMITQNEAELRKMYYPDNKFKIINRKSPNDQQEMFNLQLDGKQFRSTTQFFSYNWLNLLSLTLVKCQITNLKWTKICQNSQKYLPHLKLLIIGGNQHLTQVHEEDLKKFQSIQEIYFTVEGIKGYKRLKSPKNCSLTSQSIEQIKKFLQCNKARPKKIQIFY